MTAQVEFYFDVGSPSAYLAWTQLPGLVAEARADLVYRPVLLGGIFRSVGNVSPADVPAKSTYLRDDLARFAKRYGVPLRYNSRFPINTLGLMRGAVAALGEGRLDSYLEAIFPAMWIRDADLNDPREVATCLGNAGLDAESLFERAQSDEVKGDLRTRTEHAVRQGVFGVPWVMVGNESFFGQDRLDFVRDALDGSLETGG